MFSARWAHYNYGISVRILLRPFDFAGAMTPNILLQGVTKDVCTTTQRSWK
jgi:hypothetical protein